MIPVKRILILQMFGAPRSSVSVIRVIREGLMVELKQGIRVAEDGIIPTARVPRP
jgi:hypothetical protein